MESRLEREALAERGAVAERGLRIVPWLCAIYSHNCRGCIYSHLHAQNKWKEFTLAVAVSVSQKLVVSFHKWKEFTLACKKLITGINIALTKGFQLPYINHFHGHICFHIVAIA